MFNENGYVEHIVKGKTPAYVTGMTAAGIVVCIIGTVLVFLAGTIGIVILGVGIAVIAFSMSRTDVEYEYIMTNDDVEVARITSKSSRKTVCTFSDKDVKLITGVDSIYRDNEHQKNPNIKIMDFGPLDTNDNVYAFILNLDGDSREVLLEVDDKAMEHIGMFFKNKLKNN